MAANNIGSQQIKSATATPVVGGLVGGNTITVTGNGQSEDYAVAAKASAKDIAKGLNGLIGGLTASASTEVSFAVDATKAAVSAVGFTLEVGTQKVDILGVTSNSGLADQLKSNAAKLGISVNYDETNDTLSIKSDTGENVAFSASAGDTTALDIATKGADGKYSTTAKLADGLIANGAVSLDSAKGYALTGTGVAAVFGTSTTSQKTSIAQTDVTDATNAQNALAVIDKAIGSIDSVRSGLGATQNRLQTTVDNLQNIQKNSTAARSTVQDLSLIHI